MKKSFLFIIVVAFISSAKAQVPTELWGITEKGGYGYGTIFKTDNNGNNLVVTDAFKAPIAGKYPPEGRFCEANGKLYGVINGGIYDNGILVELNPANGVFIKKLDFNQPVNGTSPNGLVKAANGKLYGTTLNGGQDELGTLFEYDVAANTLVTKVTFNGSGNGFFPYGDLMLASNGKLYGMTQWGGTDNLGTLYEYDPGTNTLTSKIAFSGINGSSPKGALIQVNGNLYGITNTGGANDKGTLFEYTISSNTLTTKLSFGDSIITGTYPLGGLELANDSLLYGTTSAGIGASTNGILYKFNPAGAVFTKIRDFDPLTNGATPYGSLTKASNGLLYGMASQGGTTTNGTLFEFNTVTSAFNKFVDFDGPAKGRCPYSTLIQASNGKLYATTNVGGKSDRGVVFEFTIASHTYKKIIDMEGGIDGEAPRGTLMLASNGKIYCTAAFGGTKGSGILLECDPAINKGKFIKKFDFDRVISGTRPVFAPIQASNGKLYGTTESGGANNAGTLYEFDPVTNAFAKKIDFDGAGKGKAPAGLMLASNNKLYGMTTYGGLNDDGVLFEFDPATGTFTKKLDFKGFETGAYPHANLIQSKVNGKLYGLTSYSDGDHRGVLFEYDPATNTLVKKFDFGGPGNGYDPEGSLVEVSNGHFYGLTTMGGTADAGTIFEYDPVSNQYSKKYDFNTTDGSFPYGSLMIASNEKLYGMTIGGGIANRGIMFEYNWTQNQFTKKIIFDGTNGMAPNRGTLLEVCKAVYLTPQPANVILCEKKPLIINSGVMGPEYTYEWFKNGTLIKDAVSAIYKVNATMLSDAGYYHCKVSNGCRTINTPVVNVDVKPITTSECFFVDVANVIADETPVYLYPNPATDQFTIQLNALHVKLITIEIFDLLGHLVQKESRTVTGTENKVDIGIETLTSGVYMVKIWDASHQLLQEKLIKY